MRAFLKLPGITKVTNSAQNGDEEKLSHLEDILLYLPTDTTFYAKEWIGK